MLNDALEKLKRTRQRRLADSGERRLIRLRVRRQDSPADDAYWEDFAVAYRPGMNVLSLLEEVRRRPINAAGRAVSQVSWDSGCHAGRCGACTMVINGRARPACTLLVDGLIEPVRLQPLSAFPVVRDLAVDRAREDETAERLSLWTPAEGISRVLPQARAVPRLERERLALAECIDCAVCLEACPQYHENSPYVGAAAIARSRFYDSHPVGALLKDERAQALASPGGIEDCGDAQNCVKACPKGIALDDVLAYTRRSVVQDWFQLSTA